MLCSHCVCFHWFHLIVNFNASKNDVSTIEKIKQKQIWNELFTLFKNIYSLLINEPNGTINYCNIQVGTGVTVKDLFNTKTHKSPVQFSQLTEFCFLFYS